VAVRVDDIAPNGYTLDRATVRQKKTGRPVRFELTEQTRQAIDEYLRLTLKKPGDFLFAGRSGEGHGLTTRQYARLVGQWVASIGLDPAQVRQALIAPNQSDADLPTDGQSAR
jgi:integrase